MATARKFVSPDSENKENDVTETHTPTPLDVENRKRDDDEKAEFAAYQEEKRQRAIRAKQAEEEERRRQEERDKEDYADVKERLKVESSGETANDPNGGFITYVQNNVPDGEGGVKEVVHGPMPRGEWAAYSRKKGL